MELKKFFFRLISLFSSISTSTAVYILYLLYSSINNRPLNLRISELKLNQTKSEI